MHLTSARLMAAERRPACDWCGASCHDAAELERARELGVDFVVFGPVNATPSHPHANTLGWPEFARLIHGYPLPVYALGGLQQMISIARGVAARTESACCAARGRQSGSTRRG